MGFLIASVDGRTRICTLTALAAAVHVRRLRDEGIAFTLTDAYGSPCDPTPVESALRIEIASAPAVA